MAYAPNSTFCESSRTDHVVTTTTKRALNLSDPRRIDRELCQCYPKHCLAKPDIQDAACVAAPQHTISPSFSMADALLDVLARLSLSEIPLPVELWLNIVELLDQKTLAALSRASRSFRTISHSPLFRHLVIKLRRNKHARGLIRLQHKLAFYASEHVAPLVQKISIFGSSNNRRDEVDVIFAALSNFPHLGSLFIRYVRLRAPAVIEIARVSRQAQNLRLSLVSCVLNLTREEIERLTTTEDSGILAMHTFNLCTDGVVESLSAHCWTRLLCPDALRILDVAQAETTEFFLQELRSQTGLVFPRVEFLRLYGEAVTDSALVNIAASFPALDTLSLDPPVKDLFSPHRVVARSGRPTLPADSLSGLTSFYGPTRLAASFCGDRPVTHLKLYADAAELHPQFPVLAARQLTTLELHITLPLADIINGLNEGSFTTLRGLRITIPYSFSSPAPAPATIVAALNETSLPPTIEIFILTMSFSAPPRGQIRLPLNQIVGAVRWLGQRHCARLRHLTVLLYPPPNRDQQVNINQRLRLYRWTRGSGVGHMQVSELFPGSELQRYYSPRIGWKRKREEPTTRQMVEEDLDQEWFGFTRSFAARWM
ncbi:hypothetical protein C8F01DRAFT_1076133 [Mycena amicta]|nr:hypothetical protein C8F01DRAFT_1076133 [Mycena amicta]